jgi:hypothetical protein
MTDYRGPEWPPPDDLKELRKLCLVYWHLRRKAVRTDLIKERWKLEDVKTLVASRSAPIQQVAVYFDREASKMVAARNPLDVSQYEGRVAWLETALEECDEMIVHYQEVADVHEERSGEEGSDRVIPEVQTSGE